jgi:multifunctional 2-oxoglutarate metabolism enzyme
MIRRLRPRVYSCGRVSRLDPDRKIVSRYVFDTYNAAYVQAVFEQYLQNPSSVDESWRRLFDSERGTNGLLGAERNGSAAPTDGAAPSGPAAPTDGAASARTASAPAASAAGPQLTQLRAARAAGELVDAYRLHGHRAARLDPLDGTPAGHPMLSPEYHGISREELASVPAALIDDLPGSSMGEVLEWLQRTYTGSIGYEYEHLEDPGSREWLRQRIESAEHCAPLSHDESRRLLRRLVEVEALEQFLHRAYLGAKRFSIEGTDMMVPMLDLAIERAAAAGAARGRHRHGAPRPAERARPRAGHVVWRHHRQVRGHPRADRGHRRCEVPPRRGGQLRHRDGEPLTVMLAPNPSHLEFVHAVVEGMTRAKQTRPNHAQHACRTRDLVVPIIIHGDAAFSGQGVVPETLNLAGCAATIPAARCTSSPTTRSASPRTPASRARRTTPVTSRKASTSRSSTSTPTTPRPASP